MALSFSPLFVKLTVRGCSSPAFRYLKPLAKMTKKNNVFAQRKVVLGYTDTFSKTLRHSRSQTWPLSSQMKLIPTSSWSGDVLSHSVRGGRMRFTTFRIDIWNFPPHYFFKALSFPFCIELPVHTWTLNQSLWLISTPKVPYMIIKLWERTASHMPANIYGGRLQLVKRDSSLIHSKVRHYG